MPTYRRVVLWIVAATIVNVGAELSRLPLDAEPPAATSPATSVERPNWQLGDHWVIETLTDRIQGGEPVGTSKPVSLRWEFKVAKYEKIQGRDCYRLEVDCLTRGKNRPQSTVWCDRETLFLRQFQTQVIFNGGYHTVQESYDCATGQTTPVLASTNVLPLAIPAFLPKGAKGDSFIYVSQPLPAGAKDSNVIRFSHHVKQEIVPAGAKSLENLPEKYAKALDRGPVTEVRLSDGSQTVVQLWQKGSPWPVYAENGRTRAWLVPTTKP
jgi:hypothetical protein